MPVIAVVAAIGTVSAGVALGGVLGGIMIAGGVMSGLGAITGNKKLSTLGAVMSLGAGIGAAAGIGATVDAGWNAAVGGADSALGVTGKSFLDAGGSLSGVGEAIGWKGAAAPPVAPTGGDSVANSANGAQNIVDSSSVTNVQAPVTGEGLVNQSSIVPATPTLSTPTPTVLNQSAGLVNKAAGQGTGLMDKIGGAAKDTWDFVKNKDNAEIVKAGTGLLQGGLKSYSEQKALDQQLAMEQRRKDDEAAQREAFNNSILRQKSRRVSLGG